MINNNTDYLWKQNIFVRLLTYMFLITEGNQNRAKGLQNNRKACAHSPLQTSQPAAPSSGPGSEDCVSVCTLGGVGGIAHLSYQPPLTGSQPPFILNTPVSLRVSRTPTYDLSVRVLL